MKKKGISPKKSSTLNDKNNGGKGVSPKKISAISKSPSKQDQSLKLDGSSKGLVQIIESMMDHICPMSLAGSDGLGTDNMSCMIIDFNKTEE